MNTHLGDAQVAVDRINNEERYDRGLLTLAERKALFASGARSGAHIPGMDCWCGPYRDAIVYNLIIHRKAERA